MSETSPPPIRAKIVEGGGEAALPWVEFFSGMYEGDAGTEWTPTFVNLTESGGAAAITAVYSRINQTLVYFAVTIDPATSVSATAGSTYIEDFPLQFNRDTFCIAVAGGAGGIPGHVVASTNRIYIPALSAVTVPVTIIGVGIAG